MKKVPTKNELGRGPANKPKIERPKKEEKKPPPKEEEKQS